MVGRNADSEEEAVWSRGQQTCPEKRSPVTCERWAASGRAGSLSFGGKKGRGLTQRSEEGVERGRVAHVRHEEVAEILVPLLEMGGCVSGLLVSGRGQLGVVTGHSAVESETWAGLCL